MSTNLSRAARSVAALCLMVALAWISGCAAQPQELTLSSSAQGRTFRQQFTHAYCSRDGAGDMDVVLVDRPIGPATGPRRSDSPVRQMMHIRVLWHPTREMKADYAAASNATIHWYVIGNSPERGADVLEYAGTGFVLLEEGDDGSSLTIRNASVRPVACRGGLCDPVGASRIQGAIRATEDSGRVREALANIRTIVVANNLLRDPANKHPRPESPSSLAR